MNISRGGSSTVILEGANREWGTKVSEGGGHRKVSFVDRMFKYAVFLI